MAIGALAFAMPFIVAMVLTWRGFNFWSAVLLAWLPSFLIVSALVRLLS